MQHPARKMHHAMCTPRHAAANPQPPTLATQSGRTLPQCSGSAPAAVHEPAHGERAGEHHRAFPFDDVRLRPLHMRRARQQYT